MKFSCQGCCFRVEIELFGAGTILRRFDAAPRHSQFAIERGLRRKLMRQLRRRAAQTQDETHGTNE